MNTGEARKILQQMKGHFRAFEHAEEVFAKLANAESVISELEAKARGLRDECATLETGRDARRRELKTLETKHVDEIKRLDAELSQHRQDLEERKRRMTRAFKDEENALQATRKTAVETFETEKKSMADELAGLRQARDEVQKVLDDLRARVGRI